MRETERSPQGKPKGEVNGGPEGSARRGSRSDCRRETPTTSLLLRPAEGRRDGNPKRAVPVYRPEAFGCSLGLVFVVVPVYGQPSRPSGRREGVPHGKPSGPSGLPRGEPHGGRWLPPTPPQGPASRCAFFHLTCKSAYTINSLPVSSARIIRYLIVYCDAASVSGGSPRCALTRAS